MIEHWITNLIYVAIIVQVGYILQLAVRYWWDKRKGK